jgi:hypothetical protein
MGRLVRPLEIPPIRKMSTNCPAYATYEEALAHLHEYARQYAEKREDEGQYETFLSAHSPTEVFGDKWVIALKPNFHPFTFVDHG